LKFALNSLIFATKDGAGATGDERLPRDSERYQIVEVLIHSALALLETESGRASMVQVATQIIRERDLAEPPEPHLYVGAEASHDLDVWVNHFLKCMRHSFPLPYIIKPPHNSDTIAHRTCGASTMAGFNPRESGTMYFNRNIIANMVFFHQIRASRESSEEGREEADDNYARYKFHMTITVAHEIIHFLTAFLTGKEPYLYGTPPEVSVPGYGAEPWGEAGRYWEKLLLGGILEFYEIKKTKIKPPMKSKLSGDPYLIESGGGKSRALSIPMSYISRFNRGGKYMHICSRRLSHHSLLHSLLLSDRDRERGGNDQGRD
jgi:hypothetical protein